MEFLSEELNNYIEEHTVEEPSVLRELNRKTNADCLMPRMLAGHYQGRVLAMLSKMIRPDRILEIGTYTGYSAICLAEGLSDIGMLHTIDINEELENMVQSFIEKAGLSNKIDYRIGDAVDIIKEIGFYFDLVYIDADKENYSLYYDLIFNQVVKGGYIIADNVLWSGNVLKPAAEMDAETKAIVEFNKKVHDDPRVENILFPIRDGLMVARKL